MDDLGLNTHRFLLSHPMDVPSTHDFCWSLSTRKPPSFEGEGFLTISGISSCPRHPSTACSSARPDLWLHLKIGYPRTWCFIMLYHDLSWVIMIYHEFSWLFMLFDAFSWLITVDHQLPHETCHLRRDVHIFGKWPSINLKQTLKRFRFTWNGKNHAACAAKARNVLHGFYYKFGLT